MLIAGLLVAVFSVIKVAGLGLLLAEIAARAGDSPVAFISRRAWTPGERAALGFLLGWACFGAALLGLAATGLFFQPVILGALITLATGSRGAWSPRSQVTAMLTSAGGDRWWTKGAVLAALAPAVAALPLADLSWDSAVYHLGFPWQCLMIHRLPLDAVPIPFWTPLPIDIAMVVPLILGDERIGKALIILHLVALAAIWQERCRRNRVPHAGWLGIVLVLTSGLVPVLITSCKNDIPAAALCVVGALLTMRGAWGMGALLLGVGIAAKFVFGPCMACWVLAFPPRPRRLRPAVLLLLVLPVFPWIARSWMVEGHAGFPFIFAAAETWNWTAMNQTVSRFFQDQLGAADVSAPHGLVQTWIELMARDHPGTLAALLALPLFRSTRRAGFALLGGLLVTLWLGRLEKYGLPAHMLVACLAAGAIATRRRRVPRWLPHLVGAVALGLGWFSPLYRDIPWADALAPWPSARTRAGTTFEGALTELKRGGAHRIALVGDWRTYRIPARVLYGGTSGETPLAWRLAREAGTPAELRKRFRQLGTEGLLYNFVTTEWLEVRYAPFAWDRRMTRLYVEFCKEYVMQRWQSGTCDFQNGGFYMYELRPSPRARHPATVWFAPGIEPLFAAGTRLLSTGHPRAAAAAYRDVLRLIPDVGQAWNKVGNALIVAGDPRAALPYLRKFGDAGMFDAMNLPQLGAAALKTGDVVLAERVLADVLKRYPMHPLTRQIMQVVAGDPRKLRQVLRESKTRQ